MLTKRAELPAKIPGKRPTRSRALLALALLVPAPSIGVGLALGWDATRGTWIGQAAWAFSKAWILLMPLLWTFFVERRWPAITRPNRADVINGLATGFVLCVAILAGYACIGRFTIDPRAMRAAADLNGLLSPWRYVLLALYLSVVNSLLEEFVWRWFVQRHCAAIVPGVLTIVVAAGLFTVHHVIALGAQTGVMATALGSLGVLVGGLVWGWCIKRRGTLWAGWISHILADAAVFIAGWHILFAA